MKVLMLSTDQNAFQENSDVRQRLVEYANLVEELHVVIYFPLENSRLQIGSNLFLYSTHTKFKPFYFWNAYKISASIIENWNLKIENSALITVQDPFETGLVGYWLKKKFNLPLQIQVHTDFLSPLFSAESFKNWLRTKLGKWLVSKADCLRVVSERIKNSLLAICHKPIASLPIFVDISSSPAKTDLHKKYPDHDYIILMASRLTQEKNISLAIEAFSEFAYKSSAISHKPLLLIVGDGPELKNLKLVASRYSLNTNIVFEPWTNDLSSYYQTADLFLLTSNYEGYGRTIIEALANHCPVVSSNVGIASEFIIPGKSGIVFESKDKTGLVSALTEAIKNKGNLKGFLPEGKLLKSKEEYLQKYKESWLSCVD